MTRQFYARKCEVREVDFDDYKDFVIKHHNQQYAASVLCYGLYSQEGELLQLMSFGRPRFNKNYQYELIRECTKTGVTVRGGTSKLWKHFIKNNHVISCICYSYPHNGEYTGHYVDYCGFKNLERSEAIDDKMYFEGYWNGRYKRLDKTILERHGVDRLLKVHIGTNVGSNEEIMAMLGFEKKFENGWTPQLDSYFPFGVFYKLKDNTTGEFCYGCCTSKEEWDNNDYDTSKLWEEHKRQHPDHEYELEILGENYADPRKMFLQEQKLIRKEATKNGKEYHKKNPLCLNDEESFQKPGYCSECGGFNKQHTRECHRFLDISLCEECGGTFWKHKKSCSKHPSKTK